MKGTNTLYSKIDKEGRGETSEPFYSSSRHYSISSCHFCADWRRITQAHGSVFAGKWSQIMDMICYDPELTVILSPWIHI